MVENLNISEDFVSNKRQFVVVPSLRFSREGSVPIAVIGTLLLTKSIIAILFNPCDYRHP